MAVRSAALSGRKELLQWLNSLCNAEYPAVESLRDGAAYCTIIEAAVTRVSQNCSAAKSPDAAVAASRADQAHMYLAKLDWSATAAVCEKIDPSLDSVATRKTCFHNMGLLQSMLQGCVPAEHRSTVDTTRLASGKLQDHVTLLRWLYTFMSKVLAQYSKKALEKKAGAVAGSVEGVKLNRTARLRSRQANGGDVQADRRSPEHRESKPSAVEELSATPRLRSVVRSQSQTSPRDQWHHSRSDSARGGTSPIRTPTQPSRSGSRPPALGSARGRLPDADGGAGTSTPRTGTVAAPSKGPVSASAEEVLRERTVHAHYTRGTFAVPEAFCATLVLLRNDVESFEAQVLHAQERHNYHLTHRAVAQGIGGVSGSSTEPMGQDAMLEETDRETLSLDELGELLADRDQLAQQYAAVDALVTGALQAVKSGGKPMSPFLRDLVELLHPA
ncbi:hypothetical protein NESM_000768300 [Novymonas esmeraldas]|uniref:Calponin-homology (CH) domain-containing protein n=1 Tax=Novymonas esmeraldas TaxID=1808958 RepID=A0AAW0EZ25_9TRYP